MKRTFVVAGFLTVAAFASSSDLNACGDKSLAAGGIRMQRALAARYPASVLIYAPLTSRLSGATRELKLQEALRDVGHRYREVSTASDLQASVDTGQFNIILADLADLPALQQKYESSSSRVVVVSVAYKLSKAEATEAAKQCRFLIKAPGRRAQYLGTIVEAVRSKTGIPRTS